MKRFLTPTWKKKILHPKKTFLYLSKKRFFKQKSSCSYLPEIVNFLNKKSLAFVKKTLKCSKRKNSYTYLKKELSNKKFLKLVQKAIFLESKSFLYSYKKTNYFRCFYAVHNNYYCEAFFLFCKFFFLYSINVCFSFSGRFLYPLCPYCCFFVFLLWKNFEICVTFLSFLSNI